MRKNVSEKQLGFTLLELMFVVFIISILMVVALPVYQDYSTRAKVVEGVVGVGSVQKLMVEYHSNNNAFPADNSALGINPLDYRSKYVQQMDVAGDEITVTLDVPGVEGETIVYDVTFTGAYDWDCTGGTLAAQLRPSECR